MRSKLRHECPQDSAYDPETGTCCQKCEPGFGVALPCTKHNDTVCSPCTDGVTYSPVSSYEQVCRPCSQCPAKSFPVHKCNSTHNTKCECTQDFFYQSDKNMCTPCRRCRPGETMVRPCSSSVNTVCEACPPFTYTKSYNYRGPCLNCSRCKANQMLKHPCTKFQDIHCLDLEVFEDGNKDSEESGKSLIYVCCTLLGTLLLVLIIYAIVKNNQMKLCFRSCYYSSGKSFGCRRQLNSAPSGQMQKQPKVAKRLVNQSDFLLPMLVAHDSSLHTLLPSTLKDLKKSFSSGLEESNWEAFAKALVPTAAVKFCHQSGYGRLSGHGRITDPYPKLRPDTEFNNSMISKNTAMSEQIRKACRNRWLRMIVA
ncbi:unnamed protein product [Soboliphyme baturini]|uniref:TNFR-Cys domain-containing protein n=1 Tax=Soboliphyme baturini TaxID=241478 RepID=A0A183IXM4_9BILA|nr:unnamed protein product [Soboliphyme baturini]